MKQTNTFPKDQLISVLNVKMKKSFKANHRKEVSTFLVYMKDCKE